MVKRKVTKRKSTTKKKVAKRVVKRKVAKRSTKKSVRKVAKKKTVAKKKVAKKKVIAKKKGVAKKVSAKEKTKRITKKELEMQTMLERAREERKLYQEVPAKYRSSLKKFIKNNKTIGYVQSDGLAEELKFEDADITKKVWNTIEKVLQHNSIDLIQNTGLLQEPESENNSRFSEMERETAYDSIQMYLRDIGKFDLLSAKEERELASKVFERNKLIVLYAEKLGMTDKISSEGEIKDESVRKEVWKKYQKKYRRKIPAKEQEIILEGTKARNTLATANLRLVTHIAKTHTGRSRDLNLLDLVQEGADGLYKAVDGFDYRKGYKFSTYATWWIRQSVNRGLLDKSKTIRIPVHMHETIQKYNTVLVQLEQDLGRAPTVEEIASELGETIDKIYTIRRAIQNVVTLDKPIGYSEEGESTTIAESQVDEEAETQEDVASQEILRDQMQKILKDLNTRERQVIELRHGMTDGVQYTLEQIGEKLGVTRERVRQIESKAIARLREHQEVERLAGYQ